MRGCDVVVPNHELHPVKSAHQYSWALVSLQEVHMWQRLAMVPLYLADSAAGLLWCRTLTPFGFQAEERTLWQAPETYQLMSPFNQANKIKKPLLLIHGEADNNAGAQRVPNKCHLLLRSL